MLLFIDTDDRVAPVHEHFPQNVPSKLLRTEILKFRDTGRVGVPALFPFDKLSHAHPQVVDLPPLENLSEIFPKKHTLEFTIFLHYINPLTFFSICHDFESLPQRPVILDFDVVYLDGGE